MRRQLSSTQPLLLSLQPGHTRDKHECCTAAARACGRRARHRRSTPSQRRLLMALHTQAPTRSAAADASALRWRLATPLVAPGCGAARPPQRAHACQPPRGPCAHYRFPHPVEPGVRLTGSKSKKVIRLWQGEVALKTVL
jgi:hypothetical protein